MIILLHVFVIYLAHNIILKLSLLFALKLLFVEADRVLLFLF